MVSTDREWLHWVGKPPIRARLIEASSGSADRERRLHVCLAKDQQLEITLRAITPHRTRSAVGLRALIDPRAISVDVGPRTQSMWR
jgi:hypothetical protein